MPAVLRQFASANSFQRIHALWALDRCGLLDDERLSTAAQDKDRGVAFTPSVFFPSGKC